MDEKEWLTSTSKPHIFMMSAIVDAPSSAGAILQIFTGRAAGQVVQPYWNICWSLSIEGTTNSFGRKTE